MRPNTMFTTTKSLFEKIEYKVYIKTNAFTIDTFLSGTEGQLKG